MFHNAEAHRWQVPDGRSVGDWLRSIADDEVKRLRTQPGSLEEILAGPDTYRSPTVSRPRGGRGAPPEPGPGVARTRQSADADQPADGTSEYPVYSRIATPAGVRELLGPLDRHFRFDEQGHAAFIRSDDMLLPGLEAIRQRFVALQPGLAALGAGEWHTVMLAQINSVASVTPIARYSKEYRLVRPTAGGRMRQGTQEGIHGTVTADGTLRYTVRTSERTPSGQEMFDGLWDAIGGDVRRIRGAWRAVPRWTANLDTFNDGIRQGLSPEQAALRTWTGKMARRKGFTEVVDINLVGTPGNYTKVQVLFAETSRGGGSVPEAAVAAGNPETGTPHDASEADPDFADQPATGSTHAAAQDSAATRPATPESGARDDSAAAVPTGNAAVTSGTDLSVLHPNGVRLLVYRRRWRMLAGVAAFLSVPEATLRSAWPPRAEPPEQTATTNSFPQRRPRSTRCSINCTNSPTAWNWNPLTFPGSRPFSVSNPPPPGRWWRMPCGASSSIPRPMRPPTSLR